MGYQYLLNTSKQIVVKGWTFVEGIFNDTSFLPYLDESSKSKFYQGILFKSCLNYEQTWWNVLFQDDLCHVTTKDHKTYYVALNTGNTRSNWVPVLIEDIFFTYNDILHHNIWKVPHLKKHADIEVSTNLDGRIKVMFPESSVDNTLFFLNYILPAHALSKSGADLSYYQKDFSVEPIYTQCARIMPQSTDQYSLVFDLSDCSDTYLWFYQIKKTPSFEEFKNSALLNWSIVESYEHPTQVSGYVEQKTLTNRPMVLFFNTKSQKTRVRLRRALWGLVAYNFAKSDHWDNLQKYEWDLFSTFESTGLNIQSFLWRIDSDETLSKWDLVDGWVAQLSPRLELSWTNIKVARFVESINNLFTLTVALNVAYDKLAIQHESGNLYYPKSYVKSKKAGKYNISPKLGNLNPWVNKYKIFGFINKEKVLIATLDLYNLKGSISRSDLGQAPKEPMEEKLTVVYFHNQASLYAVEQLQKIFDKYKILNFFNFQWVDNVSELEGKLLMWDYDLVINTINMGLKKDISKLFATEDVKRNPSQYINPRFVSLMQQYLTSDPGQKRNLLDQTNIIYQRDMPFVILGKEYGSVYIKPSVLNKAGMGVVLHEQDRREELYKNLRIVKNVNIDMNNSWGLWEFFDFLIKTLKD